VQGGGVDQRVVVVEIRVIVSLIDHAVPRSRGTCPIQTCIGSVAGDWIKVSRTKGLSGLIALFFALRQEGGPPKDACLPKSACLSKDMSGTMTKNHVRKQKFGGSEVEGNDNKEKQDEQDAVLHVSTNGVVATGEARRAFCKVGPDSSKYDEK